VISLLTGKLPTTTRVIYPPDALRGSDSFQHLPGILKRLGYYNADISMRHYADPYDLNLRNGFDKANFRKLDESGGHLIAALRKSPRLNPNSLLVDRMAERARERHKHISKDQPMMDPLAVVNRPDRSWIRDTNRTAETERLVLNATRPFFIDVHLMGTHGKASNPGSGSGRPMKTLRNHGMLAATTTPFWISTGCSRNCKRSWNDRGCSTRPFWSFRRTTGSSMRPRNGFR
jgi:arylsulfatase A-like enzyme